jgi:hypothetical protein
LLFRKSKAHKKMKKIVLLAGLLLGMFGSLRSEAQVRFSIQIGAPVYRQSWCDYDDDYYYMPDYDVYYNVRRSMYVYPEGGTWVYAPALPARYGGCSYTSARYFRIHDRAPFNRHDFYRERYRVANNGGYYNNGGGYYRHDNGQHRGWDRGDRGWNGGDRRFEQRGNGNGGNWGGRGHGNHFDRR